MGIKTTIHKSLLPKQYQQYELIATEDGVMATTYLLGKSYVLKLFEDDIAKEKLVNEIELLSKLKNLPTPKVVDRLNIMQKRVIIYTQIQGKSCFEPTIEHIKEIALFLKTFHKQSKNIKISCTTRFQKKELKQLISLTNNPHLLKHFKATDINLENRGVIHGDLFPDNCKFIKNKLSGVFDFSDICLGDFYFDLAVVVVGWCFEDAVLNKQKVETLLKYYDSYMSCSTFNSYIKYALLYYATTRYLANRDYHILLKRLENLT
jgi:homoserine kinase type II